MNYMSRFLLIRPLISCSIQFNIYQTFNIFVITVHSLLNLERLDYVGVKKLFLKMNRNQQELLYSCLGPSCRTTFKSELFLAHYFLLLWQCCSLHIMNICLRGGTISLNEKCYSIIYAIFPILCRQSYSIGVNSLFTPVSVLSGKCTN